MSYLDLATSLIKSLEGCKLAAYLDSSGVPTIGYGHTGPEVKLGQIISQEIADHDLSIDVNTADTRLNGVCSASALSALNDHQHAALISFVFNLGANSDWTIWSDVNSGNLADVPVQMKRFVNGQVNGTETVIPGLEHRREAEIIFWNTGDVAVAAAVATTANAVPEPPSGQTRAMDTPPTPTAPPPFTKTSLGAKVVAVVGSAGAMASQLHDVVKPYAGESSIFQNVAVGLTGVVILAAAAGVFIQAHQAQARAK